VIHLDTSFLIGGLTHGSAQDSRLRQWFQQGEPLAMSAVAWAEFLCGPLQPEHLELAAAIVDERLPFSGEDAAISARLFNEGGRRRGSLLDCMIAAVALRAAAPLATANPADFRPFVSLGLTLLG
jgi:predicted nucleic acid-binding protein